MENSNTIKQEEKRKEAAKSVLVTFPLAKDGNYFTFNIVDEHGNLKYDGNVEPNPSIADDCKCPSFTNNNAPKGQGLYSDTHGFAFQCKHIIQARSEAKKQNPFDIIVMGKEIPKGNVDQTLKINEGSTFHESKMIDKSVLLD